MLACIMSVCGCLAIGPLPASIDQLCKSRFLSSVVLAEYQGTEGNQSTFKVTEHLGGNQTAKVLLLYCEFHPGPTCASTEPIWNTLLRYVQNTPITGSKWLIFQEINSESPSYQDFRHGDRLYPATINNMNLARSLLSVRKEPYMPPLEKLTAAKYWDIPVLIAKRNLKPGPLKADDLSVTTKLRIDLNSIPYLAAQIDPSKLTLVRPVECGTPVSVLDVRNSSDKETKGMQILWCPKQSLKVQPADYRAYSLVARGLPSQAMAEIDRYAVTFKHDDIHEFLRAVANSQLGNTKEAYVGFHRSYQVELGDTHLSSWRIQEHFNPLIRHDEHDEQDEQDEHDERDELLATAELAHEPPELKCTQADVLNTLWVHGKIGEVVKRLDSILAHDPKNIDYHRMRAIAYARPGASQNRMKALADIEFVLAHTKSDNSMEYLQRLILAKLGASTTVK